MIGVARLVGGDPTWTACMISAASRVSAGSAIRRRPGLPCAVGEARQRAVFPRGQARHLQHGRVPPRDRAHGAAPLSVGQLLRAVPHQPRDALRRERHRHPRGAGAPRAGRFPLASRRAPRAARTSRSARHSSPAIASGCRSDYVPGHVRMPGYIRGKTGVVVSESPVYPFPDAHAHGVRPPTSRPTTCASAPRTWPNSADTALVHVGVFQSYLERAG